MTPAEAQKKIAELRAQLLEYDDLFHRETKPLVSGLNYDGLKEELLALEEKFPEFATSGFGTSETSAGKKAEALNEEIKKLRIEIDRHNRLYYEKAAPEISDVEYDFLVKRLEKLEKRRETKTPVHRRVPELFLADSPTQRVGADRTPGFHEVEHLRKMLSLDNVYNEADLRAFHVRLVKLLGTDDLYYTIEPKIDGLAVTLTYEDGKFVRAVTRGKGDRGDEITNNVRTIGGLPHELGRGRRSVPQVVEIRGEIYLPQAEFERINAERAVAGEELYANPRNVAAGSIKLLDAAEVARRGLAIVLYGLGYCEPEVVRSQTDLHDALTAWGLPVVERIWRVKGIDEAWLAIEKLDALRRTFAYGTDGAVVKIDDFQLQRTAGETAKAPRWAIAYKYKPDVARTRLRAITIQVGKTGILSPVAELEPVFLSLSTISRATLHNEDEIRRKNIRVGDLVEIERAGEVIPAVLRSFPEERVSGAEEFDLFKAVGGRCPVCGGKIARIEVEKEGARGVAWKCQNYDCRAQQVGRLEFFCSRRALAIDGVGETLAAKLVELGLVRHVLDLYGLSLEKLSTLNLGTTTEPRVFGSKNAAKIISALEAARALPLARWLYAFAIPDVGEETAHDIAKLHDDIEAVASSELLRDIAELQRLNREMLRHSPSTKENKGKTKAERDAMKPICEEFKSKADQMGAKLIAAGAAVPATKKNPPPRDAVTLVGPVAAQSVIEWFSDVHGNETLLRLRELGISPKSIRAARSDSLFSGKTVVLTGTLSGMSRNEAQERIRRMGGNVASSVSRKTDFLVAGHEAGSKLDEANKYGVRVIDEAEFISLLEGSS
jgi:DNA ligase (NAD+)